MSFNGRTTEFNAKTLSNNGFFADVLISDFQKIHRIPTKIADLAIEHQLLLAMDNVNQSLATKQTEWQAQGHATLNALDESDNGQRKHVYKSAVFYRAKSKLLKDFQTFSRRDQAENTAQEGDSTHDYLLAQSVRSVRVLKEMATTTISVELI